MPKGKLKHIADYQLGKRGKAGTQGAQGIQGPKGDKGDIGPQGPKGDTGPVGATGAIGPTGPRGNQGVQGERGLQGLTGLQGPVPAHKWSGNSLSFQNPDGTWGKAVDLTGPQGTAGGGRGFVSGGFTPDVIATEVAELLGVNVKEAKRVDFDGTTTIYTGWAAAGTVDSDGVWRIKRTTLATDGDVIDEWADGNTNYDNIWDNRTGLSYS